MKQILSLILICISALGHAATYIVSNVPGFPANYSNLQTCVDAASNGDIIIVQGSGTSYGDIEVSKRLTIMGPGYFLNQNPETQATMASAKISSIRFSKGSDGSILQGVDVIASKNYYSVAGTVYSNYNTGSINIDSAGVSIIGCKAVNGEVLIKDANNVMVKGSYIYSIVCNSTSSNLIAENNIVYVHCDIANARLTNNLIGWSTGHYLGLNNSIAKNNFFFHAYSVATPNSILTNNCFISSDPLGVNAGNNIVNQNPNSFFVGYPTQGSYSNDGKYKLRSGSPAIGAGENGVDIGPFGGPDPYKLSGISFHPNIWFVNMPTIGTSGGGLQVQVKVNAND